MAIQVQIQPYLAIERRKKVKRAREKTITQRTRGKVRKVALKNQYFSNHVDKKK
jgi:hypothetical protein